jgi:hypothetical protein
MRNKKLVVSCLSAFLLAIFGVSLASAHTTVTNGPYNVEIGWLNEPPTIGQMNGIIMNLTSSAPGSTDPITDSISGLILTVSYGGQSKVLTLQPLGEDTPGQYVAPILPTVAGLYTVGVTGMLGTSAIKVEVQPEEVQAADSVQFPMVAATSNGNGFGLRDWVALAGLVIGLAALALALLALRKPR